MKIKTSGFTLTPISNNSFRVAKDGDDLIMTRSQRKSSGRIAVSSQSERGFTLIELLVVIAIIGILSSVVLASLSNARTRSADTAIKANLATVRSQVELYFTNNNSYGTAATLCTTSGSVFAADATVARAISAANTASGLSASCRSSASAWAVSSPLKSSGHWCIDSTGASGSRASAITTTNC